MLAAAGAAFMLAAMFGFFALRFPMGLIDALVALGIVLVAIQFLKGATKKIPVGGRNGEQSEEE